MICLNDIPHEPIESNIIYQIYPNFSLKYMQLELSTLQSSWAFIKLKSQRSTEPQLELKINLKALLSRKKHKSNALIRRCWVWTNIFGNIWGESKRTTTQNTHLSNLFISAKSNVERTGRTLTPEDEKYLRYLLTYWLGWSATAEHHMNDPCFKYIQYVYGIENLQPILDDMTYVEEAAWMPDQVPLDAPNQFLLASPHKFYIYNFEEDEFMIEGDSLKEIFEGLARSCTWDLLEKSGLREVKPKNRYHDLDPYDYFPVWDAQKRTLLDPLKPWVDQPPAMERPEWWSCSDDEDDDNENF